MKKITICVLPTMGNKYSIVLPIDGIDDSVDGIYAFAENLVEDNLNLKMVEVWGIEGM